ncbi:hypothetical protein B296_00039472 [Ensete ventricosum]|uniref:Uncharacterized protein n=1 Tax=Ensete ventricosum TaxID=4639 RepID=A0A426X7V5_ENSVE|nr:hypothetical protein B296_00039472 [Ensete ventricosum]
MIGVAGELDCFSAHIHLTELDKSEDKIENEMDSEEYHSIAEVDLPMVIKGCRYEAIDSKVMSLVAPWYRRVESSWEPRGMLQPEQKIEDSAKGKEMQRLQ